MSKTTQKFARREELRRFGIFAAFPLLVFVFVLVVPFFRGVYYTFTNWDGFDATEFVGFANYAESFQDEKFWSSLGITFAYVLASLVLVNLVGFGLALLVTMPLRGVNVLRTMSFVPNLTGGVILGMIWDPLAVRYTFACSLVVVLLIARFLEIGVPNYRIPGKIDGT